MYFLLFIPVVHYYAYAAQTSKKTQIYSAVPVALLQGGLGRSQDWAADPYFQDFEAASLSRSQVSAKNPSQYVNCQRTMAVRMVHDPQPEESQSMRKMRRAVASMHIDYTYVHGGGRGNRTYTDWTEDWEEDEDEDARGRSASRSSRSVYSSKSPKAPKKKPKKKEKGKRTSAPPPEQARPAQALGCCVVAGRGLSGRGEVQSTCGTASECQRRGRDETDCGAGTVSSRKIHQAVRNLDQARGKFRSAQKARQNLHTNWNKYLEASVKRWTSFAEDFASKDQALEEEANTAMEKLQTARKYLDELKTPHFSTAASTWFRTWRTRLPRWIHQRRFKRVSGRCWRASRM